MVYKNDMWLKIKMSILNSEYDEVDRKIARALISDASLSNAALGELVGLSSSAVHERVRKLKQTQKIKKIVALVDSEFMGMGLGCFIFVLVDGKENNRTFLQSIQEHENILECHHVTGDYSYMLKVRVANTRALEALVSDFIKGQPGIVKTMTQVILSTAKEASVIVD